MPNLLLVPLHQPSDGRLGVAGDVELPARLKDQSEPLLALGNAAFRRFDFNPADPRFAARERPGDEFVGDLT